MMYNPMSMPMGLMNFSPEPQPQPQEVPEMEESSFWEKLGMIADGHQHQRSQNPGLTGHQNMAMQSDPGLGGLMSMAQQSVPRQQPRPYQFYQNPYVMGLMGM